MNETSAQNVSATPSDTLRSWGASSQAIESHYDVGNDFYALWLDPTMSYTCGRFDPGDSGAADPRDPATPCERLRERLQQAQLRKFADIAEAIQPTGHALNSVCDIGCGWGGALAFLQQQRGVTEATGLTLSRAQASWARAQHRDLNLQIREEGWQDHQPAQPYDALISIEAIEAFVKPELNPEQRLTVYRAFFERCHAWLRPQGRFWLQAIVYGNSLPTDLDPFIKQEIFPESDLPQTNELFAASHRLFEPISLVNHRHDYVETLDHWIAGIKAHREQAEALTSPERVQQFLRYLRLSRHMFASGACDLLRLVFQKIQTRE